MQHSFFALIARMRYIRRWGLMRNSQRENVQEHSHMVAVLAHGLACIRRDILGLDAPEPDHCAAAALFHDASEIITGDLPTPIKYHSPAIRDAYHRIERTACDELLQLLPEQLRPAYAPLLHESEEEVRVIVKEADRLSAYIKCMEEEKAGNAEFHSAAASTLEALEQMRRPELDWFLAHCLPSFRLDLDELRA